jgi:archaemetzincin
VGGGYAAIVEWLRPLHRRPAAEAGEPPSRPGGHHPGLGPRRAIDVQPIGDFTPAQRRVVELEAELLGITFGLEVRVLEEIAVDGAWPEAAMRPDERWGEDQLLAPYILDELLAPRLRGDAAALLGVTARDLWSGDEWTYALGETDPLRRVGVWSLFRLGDPSGGDDERREVLRAAFATATREVARMLPLAHASSYGCNLSGADRDPPWLCPDCEAALLEATGVDPIWRYEKLIEFYGGNDLGEEEWFYERALYAVLHLEGLAPVYDPAAVQYQ